MAPYRLRVRLACDGKSDGVCPSDFGLQASYVCRSKTITEAKWPFFKELVKLCQVKLSLSVGSEAPALQKFEKGKWVPANTLQYGKIAVEGHEKHGKKLTFFNKGRKDKVTMNTLHPR
jgi:hypothetical protein